MDFIQTGLTCFLGFLILGYFVTRISNLKMVILIALGLGICFALLNLALVGFPDCPTCKPELKDYLYSLVSIIFILVSSICGGAMAQYFKGLEKK